MVWFKKRKDPHLIDTQMSFNDHLRIYGKKVFESEQETVHTVPSRWVDSLRNGRYPDWFWQHRYVPVFGFMLLWGNGFFKSQFIFTFGEIPKHIYFNWLIDPKFFMSEMKALDEVLNKSQTTQFFYWLLNLDDFRKKLHCLALFNHYVQLQTEQEYMMSKSVLNSGFEAYPSLKKRLDEEQHWVDAWAKFMEFENEEDFYNRLKAEKQGFFSDSYRKMQEDLDKNVYGANVFEQTQQYFEKLQKEISDLSENVPSIDDIWRKYYLNILELPEDLDVSNQENLKALKKAYKKAVLQVHPDRKKWNCSEPQFSLVEKAYQQLLSWHEKHYFKHTIKNDLTLRCDERWNDFLTNFSQKHHQYREAAKLWLPCQKEIEMMSLMQIESIAPKLDALCHELERECACVKSLALSLFKPDINKSKLLSEWTNKIRDKSLSNATHKESLYCYHLLKGLLAVPPQGNLKGKLSQIKAMDDSFYKQVKLVISSVLKRRQALTQKEEQKEADGVRLRAC